MADINYLQGGQMPILIPQNTPENVARMYDAMMRVLKSGQAEPCVFQGRGGNACEALIEPKGALAGAKKILKLFADDTQQRRESFRLVEGGAVPKTNQ